MLERKGHGKSVDWYLIGVLLYEMLVGKTPYYSQIKEQLLENIQNADLYFPRELSNPAKSLILQLMERDPESRLGSSFRDAEDIKKHMFFRNLDWDKVYRREYEVPKPEQRKLDVKVDISKSIYNDLVIPNGRQNNSKDYTASQSFIKNNVPGWSFVKNNNIYSWNQYLYL